MLTILQKIWWIKNFIDILWQEIAAKSDTDCEIWNRGTPRMLTSAVNDTDKKYYHRKIVAFWKNYLYHDLFFLKALCSSGLQ